MGDSSGWVPCQHNNECDISQLGDTEQTMMCTECGQTREVPVGKEGVRAGWRMVETNVDTVDGEYVRVTISEILTGRIVYSARYGPEVARTLARSLTLNSYKLEDET